MQIYIPVKSTAFLIVTGSFLEHYIKLVTNKFQKFISQFLKRGMTAYWISSSLRSYRVT